LCRDAPAGRCCRMMLARIMPWVVAKEVRALLPVWAGSVASLLGLIYVDAGPKVINHHNGIENINPRLLLVYLGTSLALGAFSVGHEYSARTLAALLTQPASRARTFLVKQSVLAVMLLSLAGVVWTTASVIYDATAIVITL